MFFHLRGVAKKIKKIGLNKVWSRIDMYKCLMGFYTDDRIWCQPKRDVFCARAQDDCPSCLVNHMSFLGRCISTGKDVCMLG